MLDLNCSQICPKQSIKGRKQSHNYYYYYYYYYYCYPLSKEHCHNAIPKNKKRISQHNKRNEDDSDEDDTLDEISYPPTQVSQNTEVTPLPGLSIVDQKMLKAFGATF